MNQIASAQQAVFISYPERAAFGCPVPKNKIYERGKVTTGLKNLFVKQVECIIWQYKLAPATVNLPERHGVQEIQIFSIQLKSAELHEDVLRCIDNAVKSPILFELNRDSGGEAETRVVAAYKRPSENHTGNYVLSSGYFATEWMPADIVRTPMPTAIDMANLYAALLQSLLVIPMRPQETLPNWVARVELAGSKRREFEKIQAKLDKEKQFNRKVALNTVLKQLKLEFEQLCC